MEARKIGENIRRLRKERGMTIKELADAVGLKESTLSLIERGKRRLNIDTFLKIVDALGVSAKLLLSEERNAVSKLFRTQHRFSKDEKEDLLFVEALSHDVEEVMDKFSRLTNIQLTPSTPFYEKPSTLKIREIAYAEREELLGSRIKFDYYELARALESKRKVLVFNIAFKSQSLSGISLKNQYRMIFVNEHHLAVRKKFSLLHEYAHHLFHLRDNDFIADRKSRRDPVEKEANLFASEFLIPSPTLKQLIFNIIGKRKRLKHHEKEMLIKLISGLFDVSRDMTFYRLEQLGYVSFKNKKDNELRSSKKMVELEWKGYVENPLEQLSVIYVLASVYLFAVGEIRLPKFASLLRVSQQKALKIIDSLRGNENLSEWAQEIPLRFMLSEPDALTVLKGEVYEYKEFQRDEVVP